MRKAIVFAIAIAVALLAGCGSNKRELEALRAEQKRGLEQMRDQLKALSLEVGRLRRVVGELDSELFEIKGQLDYGLIGGRGTDAELGSPPEAGTPSEVGPAREMPIEPIEVKDLEGLAKEVAKLRAEVANLHLELVTEKEIADLRDPRKTWEAMNDPKKLSWRLDRFAKHWSGTIEDETTRAQFVADVAELKEQISARESLSKEELTERYRAKLTERINTESNQRMRQWLEQQLRTLNTGQDRVVENQLKTFQRYDTTQGLKELASKYKISNEQLRDNGLQTYGGAYGWR